MLVSLENACVSSAGRLVDAMLSLNISGVEIALVTDDEGRLLGVLTDGDIRRALLAGATLESPLKPYIRDKYTSVDPILARAEVLELMQARGLSQIPAVDAAGRVVGLHLLQQIIGAVERPNWAVILAGGRGRRLHPITATLPKPMLKVAGRPIIERLVLHLVGFGIRNIFISINHFGNIIEDHFRDGSRFGCHILYLREDEPLGTGGPLSLLPSIPEAPIIVLNGDLVTEFNLAQLLHFHTAGSYIATMSIRPYVHEVPFGCVEVKNNCIIRLDEKPTIARSINAGIYALSPSILNRIPRQFYPLTRLFDECIERGDPVGAFPMQSDWIDVGLAEQLRQAREGAP